AELLTLMCAKVERILVKPNGFAQAISETVAALRKNQFDLALIDNNLPRRDLGQTLIEQVRAQLGADHPVRLVLLTANAIRTAITDIPATLRIKGVSSMVHRPISHAVLQQLLAREEVWEMVASPDGGRAGQHLPMSLAPSSIQGILDIIAQQTGVSFAVLVRAHRYIEAQDLVFAGSMPFRREDYADVLNKTELHLLVDERITGFTITAKERGNELLRIGGTDPAHWQIIESAGERWIFGLGHVPGRDIRNQLPLWCSALAAMLEAQAWRDWAQHVSSFVQLGLAHQGLSHEVINLEDEITSLLDSLRRWLAKQMPGVALEGKVRDYIDDKIAALIKSSSDLMDFSKRQLRGHALRHQKVFLPDAVAAIKRIVITECRESEVALHVADPPPLALPLPNAALVLPTVNLLVNAAKHHYRSENRRVELLFDLEQDGVQQFLLMDVRDNGPGLEQSTLKRLWQPGFSSATDIDKRHGIGLWLARQMVKEAGGRLDLHENWRGLGACFRLRFPIHLG
ncbi:MAG: ATP-binding protein, partial [Candidatus Methylumidiphilus sp.]